MLEVDGGTYCVYNIVHKDRRCHQTRMNSTTDNTANRIPVLVIKPFDWIGIEM